MACPDLVVGCADYRINDALIRAARKLGIDINGSDVLRIPGGAGKHPLRVAQQVVWLTEHHNAGTVLLTAHADCAASGTKETLLLTGALVSFHVWTYPHTWDKTPSVHVLWLKPAEGLMPPYHGHWVAENITAMCTNNPTLKGLGALQLRWLLHMALQGRFPS